MASFCDQACVECDITTYMNTTSNAQVGIAPPGYCTAIVHHIQYFGFVAGSQDISFTVEVTSCSVGNSIELGVYETSDCATFDLVSNCNTAMFTPNTYSFSNSVPLCVGQHYFIVIDGNAPAVCDFILTLTAGSMTAPQVVADGPLDGPTEVCANESYLYTLPITGCHLYEWTVSGGSIVGDDQENPIEVLWEGAGPGQICVTPANACNTGIQSCIDVEIVEYEPTDEGPYTICSNDFYYFDGTPYGPGTHQIDLESEEGCDSIVFLTIEEVQTTEEFVEIDICYPDCYMVGFESYCETDIYDIVLQSQVFPFCDSIIHLDLEVLEVVVELEASGVLSCTDSIVEIYSWNSFIEGDGIVTYEWTNEEGEVISDQMLITVNESGFYFLTITITNADGFSCSDMTEIEITGSLDGPDIEEPASPTICLGESIDLSTIPITDNNNSNGDITFHTDTPTDQSNQISPPVVMPDINTTYYILSTNGACTDETTIEVIVQDNPDLIVGDSLFICSGDTADLSMANIVDVNGLNGVLTFHDSIPADTTNLLDDPFVHPTTNTTYYVVSTFGDCRDVAPIEVIITAQPQIDILIDSIICIDEVTTISQNGNYGSGAIYNWSLDGGMTTDNPGPSMDVSWSSPGLKEVTLFINNGGCISAIDTQYIRVETPLALPIINCDSDESSIVFSWNEVVDALGYNVVVSTGPTGTFLDDTTYLVSNLSINEQVTIEIEVLGNGICPNPIIEQTCQASDCPTITITIDTVPDICLTTNAPLTNLNAVASPDNSGTGNWTGPGIIDATAGTFDPNLAGIGSHLISFAYALNGCNYNQQITIDVLQVPSADFIVTSPVCVDSLATVSFTGLATTSAVFSWDFGNAIQDSGSDEGPYTLHWTSPGNHSIELTVEDDGCVSSPLIQTVNVEPQPELFVYCNTTNTSIEFYWISTPATTNYNVYVLSGPNGMVASDTSYFIDGLNPGDEVIVEIEALINGVCSNPIVQLTCNAMDCPDITLTTTSIDPICLYPSTSSLVLEGDIIGGLGTGSILWTGNGVVDEAAGLFDPAHSWDRYTHHHL